jgi:hypothetical protein
MRRLYFLVPDIPSGKKVVDELLLSRIEWKHIHVVAKRGTPLEDMPEASHWQKSDVVPALQRAIPVGGATGLLCGLVGLALQPHLVVAGGGILLATSLAGVGVGAYLGGMVGLNVGNTRLKAFEQASRPESFSSSSMCRSSASKRSPSACAGLIPRSIRKAPTRAYFHRGKAERHRFQGAGVSPSAA